MDEGFVGLRGDNEKEASNLFFLTTLGRNRVIALSIGNHKVDSDIEEHVHNGPRVMNAQPSLATPNLSKDFCFISLRRSTTFLSAFIISEKVFVIERWRSDPCLLEDGNPLEPSHQSTLGCVTCEILYESTCGSTGKETMMRVYMNQTCSSDMN
ncbi:hypothetical protein Tco_0051532 [Tanacetum coccineum]